MQLRAWGALVTGAAPLRPTMAIADATTLRDAARVSGQVRSTRSVGRRLLVCAVDGAAWVTAVAVASVLRQEFRVGGIDWSSVLLLAALTGGLHLVVGHCVGLYRGRYRYGSLDEMRSLATTVLIAAGIASVLVALDQPIELQVARSAPLLALPLAITLMAAVRFVVRQLRDRRRPAVSGDERALVIGAGELGEVLLRAAAADPASTLHFVGLLDDDPTKRRLTLRGVPVLGPTDVLAEAARVTGATSVVIAVGSADPALLRRLTRSAEQAGLRVYLTPPPVKLISGEQEVTDLRDISAEDLLGRPPVDTRMDQIAGYLTGRRVLVTGAGGSIGSELCRQIAGFAPSELIMLDRDETGLQTAQLGTVGHGLLDTKDVVLADIRDLATLQRIFDERRPDVVFHAAALKHLPMLEQYPQEAWKTNVLGTLNVLRAAMSVGVSTFVNVSTDKAANPTSVLGHSKRAAEQLTAWAARTTGRPYLSVRFGNVIGSRGSMLPTFRALIQAGGPVTVTHPEATRYFMTIPEACQLVVQAGGIGRAGEVLILDMGQPVRILDIAQRMIAMSGKNIDIVFTGLREGEKLHEELTDQHESLERPFHPKISHTCAPVLRPEDLGTPAWLRAGEPLPTVPAPRAASDRSVLSTVVTS